VLLVLVVGGFVAAGARPGPPGLPEVQPEGPSGTLPLTSPSGWPRGAVESYDRDTLYEKINGKADAYLVYGLAGLRFASYANPADPDEAYVDVYAYDMGTPLDAFGMYRSQRTGRETAADIGDEGVDTGRALFARRGPYYLEVMASGPRAEDEARALAGALADALSSDTPAVVPPAFPTDGLRIVRFERQGAFGVSTLRDAFVALYEDGASALLAEVDDPAAAVAEARDTFDFLGEAGLFEAEDAYVIGAVGGDDDARREALLEALRDLVPEEPR
jgi:hypothetical protein